MLPAPLNDNARFRQRTTIRPRVAYEPPAEHPTFAEQIAFAVAFLLLTLAVAVWQGVGP